MRLKVLDKSLALDIARLGYAQHGPFATIAFVDGLARSAQEARGWLYFFRKRTSLPVTISGTSREGLSLPRLARGKWQVQSSPVTIQGVTMHRITAYLPRGTWRGGNKEHYFVVLQGHYAFDPWVHLPADLIPVWDEQIRRWAENFTPYPIPRHFGVRHLLAGWRLYSDQAAPLKGYWVGGDLTGMYFTDEVLAAALAAAAKEEVA